MIKKRQKDSKILKNKTIHDILIKKNKSKKRGVKDEKKYYKNY